VGEEGVEPDFARGHRLHFRRLVERQSLYKSRVGWNLLRAASGGGEEGREGRERSERERAS